MKISRKGLIPQLEIGPWLGGVKVLFQRSGIVMNSVTMVTAMISAWSTTAVLRELFRNDFRLFMGAVVVAVAAWMTFDYVLLLPSQQTFTEGQRHRSERSPLKRDTEEILAELEACDERAAADGGERDDA